MSDPLAGLTRLIDDGPAGTVPARSRQTPARWRRRTIAVACTVIVLFVLFVPLPHISVFDQLSRPPTNPVGHTTTTEPAATVPNSARGAIRDGALVPANSLSFSFSFSNRFDGAALFFPDPELAGEPVQLATTTDGGNHWRAVGGVVPLIGLGAAVLRTTSSLIAWQSAAVGYVWSGSELLRTSDGGARWQRIPNPAALSRATVGVVDVDDGTLWVGFWCPGTNGISACANPLWSWSPELGWRSVTIPHVDSPIVEIERPHGRDVLVLTGSSLIESDDFGTSWTSVQVPCKSLTWKNGLGRVLPFAGGAESVVSVKGAVVLECVGPTGPGYQPLSFWSRPVLGSPGRWTLESDNAISGTFYRLKPVGVAPSRGYGLTMAASPGRIWLPLGRNFAELSTDDGHIWSAVPALREAGSAGYSTIEFVDATHGWCLFVNSSLWSTSDGGAVWKRIG